MTDAPRILVAGASGYIGRALIPKLLEKFANAQITALSRSQQKSDDSRVTWKACDLFSLKSIEEATPAQVHLAFYLVHSMGPTAQLDQGSFADYDLLLADNFARVMKARNVQHMLYLGGLMPTGAELSLHLRSRLEVEELFAEYKLPLTVFRAGLILGAAGSSFQILLKLVKRLPVMICPRWTQTLTTPVDLHLVLTSMTAAALAEEHIGHTYDLAGCEPLTYVRMMQETARRLGLKRWFITVPFFTPTLSRLWVRLITNSPKNLVYPLIESLEHPMVARSSHLFSRESFQKTYFELLENAFLKTRPGRNVFRFSAQRRTVRSVQRMVLPQGRDAEWVRDQYFSWVSGAMWPVIEVKTHGSSHAFGLRRLGLRLLEMTLNVDRSNRDRQLFNIRSGMLVAADNQGRLEFRVVLGRRFVLVAIHDFRPALPWFIYKYTQAAVHLMVMRAFASELTNKNHRFKTARK